MNNVGEEQTGQEKHQQHKHTHISHMLMMALCCGLPVLLIALIPLIGRFIPGISNSVYLLPLLLCPLMMIPMMIGGMREKKESENQNELQKSENSDKHSDSGSCH